MSKREKSDESLLNRTVSDKGGESTHNKSMINTTSSKSSVVNTKENIYRSEDFIQSYLNNKIAEITKSFDLRETVRSYYI